jgi:hypothetical protein
MRSSFLVCVILSVLVAGGCSRYKGDEPKGKEPRPDKKAKVSAEISFDKNEINLEKGERITFKVHIINLSDEVNTLEFQTSKQYAVYAIDTGGRQYHLGPYTDDPIPSRITLAAYETMVFDLAWDGHVYSGRDVVYLPRGRYEIEARIMKARSNTDFVWVKE